MAVVIETTLGDIIVDLFVEQRPQACLNFIKLCKVKYYNFNLFHTIRSGFIAQSGDPTGEGSGGESIWGVLQGTEKRYFSAETRPKIKHSEIGTLSMVGAGDGMIGSQFFFTLAPDLDSLDDQHCVIGEVVEGQEVLRKLNEVICDSDFRPYQDVRITHTVILEDPFKDPNDFREPSRSPSPSAERLAGGRIAPDDELDETKGKSAEEVAELVQEKEAKARATILEIVGDLPDADIAPPENVLFVCKLNPVTTDEDLEIIFSRFGNIKSCEVIRDKKTGDSLQYAFIEFESQKSCEDAYFKMDNVLIDDRRIHVDFSQSVSKLQWRGKGRGVVRFDNKDENSVYDHKANPHQSDTKNSRAPRDTTGNKRKSYNKDDDRYSKKLDHRSDDRHYKRSDHRYDNRSSDHNDPAKYRKMSNDDKNRERNIDRHGKSQNRSNDDGYNKKSNHKNYDRHSKTSIDDVRYSEKFERRNNDRHGKKSDHRHDDRYDRKVEHKSGETYDKRSSHRNDGRH